MSAGPLHAIQVVEFAGLDPADLPDRWVRERRPEVKAMTAAFPSRETATATEVLERRGERL